MPIEINELIMRAQVSDTKKNENSAGQGGEKQSCQSGAASEGSPTRQTSEIVADILKRQKER